MDSKTTANGCAYRLFNDADIDRTREIKRWIDNGVQQSVALLSSDRSNNPMVA